MKKPKSHRLYPQRSVQLRVRLTPAESQALRELAAKNCDTMSITARALLRIGFREVGRGLSPESTPAE